MLLSWKDSAKYHLAVECVCPEASKFVTVDQTAGVTCGTTTDDGMEKLDEK